MAELLKGVAEGIGLLDREGGKILADATAAQLAVVEAALGVDLGIPMRDFYPRSVRDERRTAGGWPGLS